MVTTKWIEGRCAPLFFVYQLKSSRRGIIAVTLCLIKRLGAAIALSVALPGGFVLASDYGTTGLIDIPTARFEQDGVLSVGASIDERHKQYSITYQATPWLQRGAAGAEDDRRGGQGDRGGEEAGGGDAAGAGAGGGAAAVAWSPSPAFRAETAPATGTFWWSVATLVRLTWGCRFWRGRRRCTMRHPPHSLSSTISHTCWSVN